MKKYQEEEVFNKNIFFSSSSSNPSSHLCTPTFPPPKGSKRISFLRILFGPGKFEGKKVGLSRILIFLLGKTFFFPLPPHLAFSPFLLSRILSKKKAFSPLSLPPPLIWPLLSPRHLHTRTLNCLSSSPSPIRTI